MHSQRAAFLERAGPAQQLVLQVTVTRLHVHEVEPGALREHGGRDVVVRQVVELGIGRIRVRRGTAIEERVSASGPRVERPTTGVGELQPGHLLVGQQ